MPKKIALFMDGTLNQFGGRETNVLRLYRLACHQSTQITYYQPGVGTLAPVQTLGRVRAWLLKLLDAATAWMIERHVASAYRFLMQHYEQGDEIFVFGFSRGAYAARVLCGMLHAVGLLRPGHEEMVPFAWREYGRSWKSQERADRFREAFSSRVQVRFLGIWDSVSSIGPPWALRSFAYTANNDSVACIRHALALDERRVMFAPNLWDGSTAPQTDVRQLWFSGKHSDVGGGAGGPETPADELSLIPFHWMLEEGRRHGLELDEARVAAVGGSSSLELATQRYYSAPLHESMTFAWRLLEFLPVPRWRRMGERWKRSYRWHLGRPRHLRPSALVHNSVRDRGVHIKDVEYVER